MRAAELRSAGVSVLAVASNGRGKVPLRRAVTMLGERLRVRTAMVEGGTEVIASCALERAAHRVVLTLAPKLTHGTRPAFHTLGESAPSLEAAACKLHDVQVAPIAYSCVLASVAPALSRPRACVRADAARSVRRARCATRVADARGKRGVRASLRRRFVSATTP